MSYNIQVNNSSMPMTSFTLAELDEIYHAVKTYMKNENDTTMKVVHKDIIRKVNEMTAEILETSI